MDYRLPYYMAYPLPLQYDDERIERRDYEYMKSMYPMAVKKILPYVEEECDRMAYEGSMIYDEYPDRWQLYRLAESIVNILKNEAEEKEERHTPEKWEWISDMVQVLLFDEIFNRRHGNQTGRKKNQFFMGGDNWKSPYGDSGIF